MQVDATEKKIDPFHRIGRQLGTITAILRTHGPFIIHSLSEQSDHIALQISRNMQQYFYADSIIFSAKSNASYPRIFGTGKGNVLSVCIGTVPQGYDPEFPIQAMSQGISVDDGRELHWYGEKGGKKKSVGAIFLRPLEDERLELVVWGTDAEALFRASRLVPTVTGVGQPDFVVLGESAGWRGMEGALAMGFLDSEWRVSGSSVVS